MKNFEQFFQKRWYGIRTHPMKVKSLERNMSSSNKTAHLETESVVKIEISTLPLLATVKGSEPQS